MVIDCLPSMARLHDSPTPKQVIDSVPHQLVQKQLDARFTATTAECFHKGERVASHVRSFSKGHHTIVAEHMLKSHREYAEWTPQRLIR
ncbi:hypothetical protein Ga0074115_11439 [endosymbiont of Ridgeia piscesae]|jgi:transposase|uniref:Transposase for insertion sequence element IS21-like C-terminal domain-containing protein n=1 Tax=endosymbiont of Ridgeia piscesae TaxID=54398 RepID=A0A0T5Z5L6_9GAMM|nr:hypothetical protein Ga0074115_11439 [endosymbiont of Ridgeia piscesae]KRT58059.1 hypothetical protein Ga0076813_127315 [endosymbiont of Ridgeia piscesae]